MKKKISKVSDKVQNVVNPFWNRIKDKPVVKEIKDLIVKRDDTILDNKSE